MPRKIMMIKTIITTNTIMIVTIITRKNKFIIMKRNMPKNTNLFPKLRVLKKRNGIA